MKSMKKVTACVLSTVFVVAVSDIVAISRYSRQEEVSDVQEEAVLLDPAVQSEKPKPKPQNIQDADAVVAEEQPQEEDAALQEEVKRSRLVRSCCSKVMDEVEKLDNPLLAEDLCQMVEMVQTQEMNRTKKLCGKCPCIKPKPSVQQVVQPKPVAQQASPSSDEVQLVDEKTARSSKMLLRECCSALMQEAERTCDCPMAERINAMREDVERINEKTTVN